MPRIANPPVKAVPAAVVPARGKTKAPAGRIAVAPEPVRLDHKVECPLCIEELDTTDLSFQPCPCGYRVCLFCFEKIKLHNRSICPGCRRPYGSVADSSEPKDEDTADQTVEDMAASSSQTPPKLLTRQAPPGFGAQALAVNSTMKNVAGKTSSHVRKLSDHSTQAKRQNATITDDMSQALPSQSTAAWGSPTISRQDSVELPNAVDETAWPSLADSTAAAATAAMGNNRQRGDHESSVSRVSSSSLVGQLDRAASCTSETLSCEVQVQNGFAYLATPTNHATLATTVNGVRRTVCVPLAQEQVDPYPEAHAMVSRLQQAVRTGTMASRDAASELLALLKNREKEMGRTTSLLACGKAPPGFSVSNRVGFPQSSDAPMLGTSPLNNCANPIVPPPTAKCRPISPPLVQGTGPATAQPKFVNGGGAPVAMNSMWTNSCLPGIDSLVSLAGNNWPTGPSSMFVSIPTPVPCNPSIQLGPSNLDPPVNFSGVSSLKPPPPGFGPAAINADAAAYKNGYKAPYAPIGTRYNPLEFSTAKNPAPGAYRPQLGPQPPQNGDMLSKMGE